MQLMQTTKAITFCYLWYGNFNLVPELYCVTITCNWLIRVWLKDTCTIFCLKITYLYTTLLWQQYLYIVLLLQRTQWSETLEAAWSCFNSTMAAESSVRNQELWILRKGKPPKNQRVLQYIQDVKVAVNMLIWVPYLIRMY